MRRRALIAAVLAALAVAVVGGPALADGTEALGPPSIAIAEGSGLAVGGTGLNTQPGTITVDVPAGATVEQVLLYWSGFTNPGTDGDPTVTVDGTEVTGQLIGGPTPFFSGVSAWTYRADITALGAVTAGANSLAIAGAGFSFSNDGAGVVVVYDDGSSTALALRDGSDLAFRDFQPPLDTTVPQTFAFEPSDSDRTAQLSAFASSVEDGRPRPNALLVTIGGVTTTITDPFSNSSGPEWDTFTATVTVPAGATELTVQAVSQSDGSDNLPASFNWIGAFLALAVDAPPPGGDGCTATQGYWKTHSEHGPAPYDATWAQLPDGADTALFDSGKTWHEAFWTPPKGGNAYWILAHQYMAAHLNSLAGADTSDVADTLVEAEALLDAYDTDMGAIKGSVRNTFTSLAGLLDDYNNGNIGPGHCD